MSAVPSSAPRDAFSVLLDLERRSRGLVGELPSREQAEIPWSSVGFRVGKQYFAVGMEDVREILNVPDVTRVPGTVAWVKGVANVRGNLLPIIDIGGFLEGATTRVGRRARVLAVKCGTMSVGLMVDEVLGLKHVTQDQRVPVPAAPARRVTRYVDGAFRDGGEIWSIFDMGALSDDPAFLRVSLSANPVDQAREPGGG